MELQLIQSKIYEIRGTRVMLDFDLAVLYQTQTRILKQAVRRNIDRFPLDFMFELTAAEWAELITNCDKLPQTVKHNPTTPMVFTEQGVAMLSSVLRSKTAIEINISIMRAFVAMRQYLVSTTAVTAELAEIRAKLQLLERNEEENLGAINDLSEDLHREICDIYQAIGELSARPASGLDPNRRRIGYAQASEDPKSHKN